MAVPKIQIVFTNDDKIFYPGENVTGYVKISTKREIKCKGFLTFEGLSYVHLKGVKSKKSDLDSNYSTKEEYYNKRFQIVGGVLATTYETLTVGDHNFDFEYRLPHGIPSSYDSKNGYVKHYCEVNLEINKSLSSPKKVKYTEDFHVNSIFDLSEYRHMLQSPAVKEANKDIDTFFGRKGKISAKIKIGRTAYVPDENIVIDVTIRNTSSLILCTAKAKLIQEIKYKVNHHSLIKNEVIGSAVKNYRAAGTTINYDWSVELIKVPRVPSSYLHGCKIIDIQYSFQFQVFSKSKGSPEIEEEIPLIIGSLLPQNNEASPSQINEKPLASSSSFVHNASAPEYEPVPFHYDNSNVQNFTWPSAPSVHNSSRLYPDIAPPSYEEAVPESNFSKE